MTRTEFLAWVKSTGYMAPISTFANDKFAEIKELETVAKTYSTSELENEIEELYDSLRSQHSDDVCWDITCKDRIREVYDLPLGAVITREQIYDWIRDGRWTTDEGVDFLNSEQYEEIRVLRSR